LALEEDEWSVSCFGGSSHPERGPVIYWTGEWGKPHSQSGRGCEEESPEPAGNRTSVFQSVANHFPGCVIPIHCSHTHVFNYVQEKITRTWDNS